MRRVGLRLLVCITLAVSASPLVAENGVVPSPVDRGKYLATLGNCVSCHTNAGGALFAGGVAFATPFGIIYSTNITPDQETGIGRWTQAQFRRAMREGVRADGEHLYPVFPYTAFTKLADGDVDAIYAYVKTLPPVSARPPENELSFPFNVRSAVAVWKAWYFDAGRFVARPDKSVEWNRGAYLVEGLGHCSACHTPRNLLGAERTDWLLTGGTYQDNIPNGELRRWSAVNLTPAPSGLRAWSSAEIVAYLKTGLNSFATAFGPMNAVIMNSTRHLEDRDAAAIAVYLKGLEAKEQGEAAKVDAQASRNGESLYAVHCATCHLPNGQGSIDTGPAMVGNPVVQAGDPASLINVILHGPQLSDPGPPVQRTHMEAYSNLLSDDEVAALSSFMRSAWGNRGGLVTASQVAEQR